MLFEDSHVVCTHAEIMLAFIKALPLHIVTSAKKPIFTGFLGIIPISQLKVPRKAYQRQEKRNFDTFWLTSFYDRSTYEVPNDICKIGNNFQVCPICR